MYREVTMLEVQEVLRLRGAGLPKKRIAAQLGLDPKTVRRYLAAAADIPLGPDGVSEAALQTVLLALHPSGGRPRGDGWDRCATAREAIARWLREGVRLTKIRKLLQRQGVLVAYPTLYRFAVLELQFGRTATTLPIVDGPPGQEVQLDTGWVGRLTRPGGRHRRFRAWIFTPVCSRYRFVYPTFEETTARAIEACEAAWTFYGGSFPVIIPDNAPAIITTADDLAPRINPVFLEYAQARHFHIDAARVRHPRDKARVERSVSTVRDDAFAGEILTTIEAARTRGLHWCREDYGLRRHSRTQRAPREHFEAEEQAVLRPVPLTVYDTPLWSEPRVGRDQRAAVAKALDSLPHRFVGRVLQARADRQLVRFYDQGQLVKTHPRKPAGDHSTDPTDYPVERRGYAFRDVDGLLRQATSVSAVVGRYAARILDAPLPWTRMRRVYALLGLVRRFGEPRVSAACTTALAVDLIDVHRLRRMLEQPTPAPPVPPARPPAPARYLRPAEQFALPLTKGDPTP
jgi:transposase